MLEVAEPLGFLCSFKTKPITSTPPPHRPQPLAPMALMDIQSRSLQHLNPGVMRSNGVEAHPITSTVHSAMANDLSCCGHC